MVKRWLKDKFIKLKCCHRLLTPMAVESWAKFCVPYFTVILSWAVDVFKCCILILAYWRFQLKKGCKLDQLPYIIITMYTVGIGWYDNSRAAHYERSMQIMCVCELSNIHISESLLLHFKEPQKLSFSLSFFDLVIYSSIKGPHLLQLLKRLLQHSLAAML